MNINKKIISHILLFTAGFTIFALMPKTPWHSTTTLFFIISLLTGNITLNMCIKTKSTCLIISTILSPLLFCLLFYLNNYNDLRIFKYLPIQYIYMIIYMFPLLIPINNTTNEIIKACRQKT